VIVIRISARICVQDPIPGLALVM